MQVSFYSQANKTHFQKIGFNWCHFTLMQQIELILYTLTRFENESFGSHGGGHGPGVYGIALLSFFPSGISVILILMYGIAVQFIWPFLSNVWSISVEDFRLKR